MTKIEIGTIYSDPEGVWQVVAVDGKGFVDVENVQQDNTNYGKTFSVTEEEAEYFINGGE